MVLLHFKLCSVGWKNTCEAKRHCVVHQKAEVVPLKPGKNYVSEFCCYHYKCNAFSFTCVYLPREKMTSCVTLVVWHPSLRDCKQEEVRKNSAHYFKNSLEKLSWSKFRSGIKILFFFFFTSSSTMGLAYGFYCDSSMVTLQRRTVINLK